MPIIERVLLHFVSNPSARGKVLATSIALTAIGVLGTANAYRHLRANVEEILPHQSPSVKALQEMNARLQAIDSLAILVTSMDRDAGRRFTDDLGQALRALPKEKVAAVEYRLSEELLFFKKRSALFMELEDLRSVRNYVQDRIEYEKALYNPLNLFSRVELDEPRFDLGALKNKYMNRISDFSKYPGGYYATPDEKTHLLLAYRPYRTLPYALALKSAVNEAIARLEPSRYAPDLQISYGGSVQIALEEARAFSSGFKASVPAVALFCLLWVALFSGSLRLALFWWTSMIPPITLTLSFAYLAFGSLNALTVFILTIVFGIGAGHGIVFLSSYVRELRRGASKAAAIRQSLERRAVPSLGIALLLGACMATVAFARFEGITQFAATATVGLLLSWLSAHLLLPALLLALGPAEEKLPRFLAFHRAFANGSGRLVHRSSGWIVARQIAMALFSVLFLFMARERLLEPDLTQLRSTDRSPASASASAPLLQEILHHPPSPMVVLARDSTSGRRLASELGRVPGVTAETLEDLVPERQKDKVALLRELQRLLPKKVLARLPAQEQDLVRQFITPEALRPFTWKDLPPLILTKFQEKDGSVGKLVFVKLRGPASLDPDQRARTLQLVESIAEKAAPQSSLAGQDVLNEDILLRLKKAIPIVSLLALALSWVMLQTVLRSPRLAALILLTSLATTALMLTSGAALGVKVNFLSFIAIPFTLGLTVNHSLALLMPWIRGECLGIHLSIRRMAATVLVCGIAAIAGYASLLTVGNGAFVNFGKLAVLGEISALTSSLLFLPALLHFVPRELWRGRTQG